MTGSINGILEPHNGLFEIYMEGKTCMQQNNFKLRLVCREHLIQECQNLPILVTVS